MFLLPVFHSFLFNEHLLVPSLDPCFPLPCCTSNISILILVSHFLEQSSHFRFLNNCSSVRHPHMFNCSWPCSFNILILKVAMNSVSQQEMQELELDVVNAKPFKSVVLLIIGKRLTFFFKRSDSGVSTNFIWKKEWNRTRRGRSSRIWSD